MIRTVSINSFKLELLTAALTPDTGNQPLKPVPFMNDPAQDCGERNEAAPALSKLFEPI